MTIQRCTVKGLVAGVIQTRNVFYADLSGTGSDPSEDLWEDYLDSIYGEVIDMTSSAFVITSFILDYFDGMTSTWMYIGEYTYTFTGNAGGDPYNSMISPVLIARTAISKVFGRKFLPPTGEQSVSGNNLVSGALVMMASALLGYITPFVGSGGVTFTPGVIDKGDQFRFFTSGSVAAVLGTMRRRKEGRGV